MTRAKKNLVSAGLAGLAAALVVLTWGCDATDPDMVDAPGAYVLVANQGNFSDSNGSVTRYDPETGEVTTLVSSPGSIIQSLTVRDERVYVAMNTGDRIDVVDPARGVVDQILDVTSPRYMAWTDTDRLVISNLFDNTVSVVNITGGTVTGVVDVGSNPEGVTVHGGRAYVSNHGFGAGTSVSVIDLAANAIAGNIETECDGPRFTFVDREAEMWIVCTGRTLYDSNFNVIGTTDGAVLVTSLGSGQVVKRFAVDGLVGTAGPGQDAYYSAESEALFVVVSSSSIHQFDTSANQLVREVGPLPGPPIGAIAYDPIAERLYVGRVPGFTMAGSVDVLSLDGTSHGSFTAGVAPSHIEIVRGG